MMTLFGNKVRDYVIFIFTGGDDLEDSEQTLNEFLETSPTFLKVCY